MKFKLLVNPQKEELVQAQVHQENDFTQELKKFVLIMPKSERSWVNMKKFIKDFALRGMITAGFGPLILVSIYLGLQLFHVITSIPVTQVNLNIVSSLILAFIAGGISAIFNVEQISLGVATLIDAIVIYFDYLVIYLINNWIKAQFIPLLIFTIIYIIGYLIIWTIIHRKVKSQVKQINQKL